VADNISVRQFSFKYYNFFGIPIGTNLWRKSKKKKKLIKLQHLPFDFTGASVVS
jgi:hypothetical protein